VTPGWVDVHTHYDGQAIWDPLLGPSCWHGVTTAMFGNCGVGFAPVRAQHRGALMELMEGVEEIPGVVLTDGLTWEWEDISRVPRCAGAPAARDRHRRPDRASPAARLRHGRARHSLEAARPEDIAQMRRLTSKRCTPALFGFTTSRTDSHKTPSARWSPRDMQRATSS